MVIRARSVGWVPAGAWLTPTYAEWQPPAALRGAVACLWASVAPDGDLGDSLVLPDGCSDLIWEHGAGGYVAGPDTGPFRPRSAAGTVIVGARFRPAAGGPALGLPLSELRDQRVPLADLLPAQARPLSGALSPAAAARALLDVTGRLVAASSADSAIARAAALLRDPAARTEDIAWRVGLSERQLRRRTHAAAGTGRRLCSGSSASSASSARPTRARDRWTWRPPRPWRATPISSPDPRVRRPVRSDPGGPGRAPRLVSRRLKAHPGEVISIWKQIARPPVNSFNLALLE